MTQLGSRQTLIKDLFRNGLTEFLNKSRIENNLEIDPNRCGFALLLTRSFANNHRCGRKVAAKPNPTLLLKPIQFTDHFHRNVKAKSHLQYCNLSTKTIIFCQYVVVFQECFKICAYDWESQSVKNQVLARVKILLSHFCNKPIDNLKKIVQHPPHQKLTPPCVRS